MNIVIIYLGQAIFPTPSGNFKVVGTKFLKSRSTQNIWDQSFQIENSTMVWDSTIKRWQYLMFLLSIFTQIIESVWRIFVSNPSFYAKRGIPTTSRQVHIEYWAFAQHCRSVFLIYSTNLLMAFPAIAKPTSSNLKWLFEALILLIIDAILED